MATKPNARSVREGLDRLNFAFLGETALNMLDGCVGEEIILMVSDINSCRA